MPPQALLADSFQRTQGLSEIMICRQAAFDLLAKQVLHHMQAPMGIGSKAASLEVKTRAMIFSAWLERGEEQMPQWCSSLVSMTTDLGTESGILDFHSWSWRHLMPAWTGLAAGLQADTGSANFVPVIAEPLFFPRGFTVPGLLHVINNMTLEVDTALDGWQNVITGLRAILSLLTVSDRRRRFVATCVHTSPHGPMLKSLFAKDLPSIVDWRWSILTKVLKPLRQLKWPLQATTCH